MSERAAWIHAWKPSTEAGFLVSCETEDPCATRFDVHWRGAMYSITCIMFDKRYLAERVVGALVDVFDAGKRQYAADLREFLGISNRR